MKTIDRNLGIGRLASRAVLVSAAIVTLGACTMTAKTDPTEGIGFRQARFEEISAMQSYRKCRDDGLALDAQARETGDPARYIASARLLEKCEAEIGPEAAGVAQEERMRAYALSVQNYLKGGEIQKAAANLESFEGAFPGKDLYFFDGASFIETMSALLGQKQKHEFGQFAMLNVGDSLKGEMRRVKYWKHN